MTETDTGLGGASERLHILLVGPRIISGEVIGGTKIAFELLIHEENGLFVAGSPESIRESALRVSSDDRLFQRLREGALHTGARFRSPRAAARIEALCRDAAGSGRS